MRHFVKCLALLLGGALLLSGCSAGAQQTAGRADSSGAGSAPSAETGASSGAEGAQETDLQGEDGGDGRPVYRMELALDTAGTEEYGHARLTGTVSVSFTNDSSDVWEQVCLRDYVPAILAEDLASSGETDAIAGLSSGIAAVREGDHTLSFTQGTDPTVIFVALEEPMQPGDRRTLEVDYRAEIPCGGYRLSWFPVGEQEEGLVFSLGPFYPVLSVYDQGEWNQAPYFLEGECFYAPCGDYEVSLTLPSDFTVVSTGSESTDGAGHWTLRAERVRDFAILASNCYESVTETVEGVEVRSWYLDCREGARRSGEQALQAAKDALETFTRRYGPYVYDQLDVVESVYEFGGLEYPALVRINQTYLTDQEEEQRLWSNVVHEVAHQWFYAALGNDQYREAWLDESFAAFSELVCLEDTGAPAEQVEACRTGWESGQETLQFQYIDLSYDAYEGVPGLGDYGGGGQYIHAVYDRGPLFLYQLREAMGEEAFFSFVQRWYTEHMFDTVTTQAFLEALYESCGDDPEVAELVARMFSTPYPSGPSRSSPQDGAGRQGG